MSKYPWQQRQDERREERRPKPKGNLPIKRQAVNKIATKSAKLKEAEKIYSVLAKDYLKDHPKCECGRAGCSRKSEEIHHKRGRGKYLCRVEYFCAVARVCHEWIHSHDKEARELGLLISRLAKDIPMQEATVDLQEGIDFTIINGKVKTPDFITKLLGNGNE